MAEPPGPFADALRRLRAAAGLTQEALAGAAGDGCRLTSPGNPADGAIALTDSSAIASRC